MIYATRRTCTVSCKTYLIFKTEKAKRGHLSGASRVTTTWDKDWVYVEFVALHYQMCWVGFHPILERFSRSRRIMFFLWPNWQQKRNSKGPYQVSMTPISRVLPELSMTSHPLWFLVGRMLDFLGVDLFSLGVVIWQQMIVRESWGTINAVYSEPLQAICSKRHDRENALCAVDLMGE